MNNEHTLHQYSNGLKGRIDTLTSLRFFMLMIIVFSHFEFLSGGENPNIYDYFFHNPAMGVNFFFIMSGFGLAYSSHNANICRYNLFKGYKYAMQRMKKLYWLYVITMLVMFPVVIIREYAFSKDIFTTITQNIEHFVFSLTLIQSALGVQIFSHLFNSVCWFLSTLFILYMIYPLLEVLNKKYMTKKSVICFAIIVTIVLFTISHYVFAAIEEKTSLDDLAYSSPYIRIFPFVMGILLCDLFMLGKKDKKTNKAVFGYAEIAIVALVICWYCIKYRIFVHRFDELKAVVDMFLAMMLLYIFAFEQGYISKILRNKTLVLLGKVSMYIFLIHFPLKEIAVMVFANCSASKSVVNAMIVISVALLTTLFTF